MRPRGENVEYDKLADRFYASNRALADAEKRIRELEAALRDWRKYHAHLEFCNLARPCSCGFDVWAESIEKLLNTI